MNREERRRQDERMARVDRDLDRDYPDERRDLPLVTLMALAVLGLTAVVGLGWLCITIAVALGGPGR